MRLSLIDTATATDPKMYKRCKMIGISDRSECDCCGKTNLRSTIVLEVVESGERVAYGADCAAKSLRQRVSMFSDKRAPISREAAVSMARRARNEAVYVEQRVA